MFRVLCPCCGTEIEVPDQTSAANHVSSLPKDGTYFLIPKTNSKGEPVQDKLFDFMKNMNIPTPSASNKSINFNDYDDTEFDPEYDDSECYTTRDERIEEMKKNKMNIDADTKAAIERQITDNGYINNNHLFRRWIMAQTLRAFFNNDCNQDSIDNFHKKFIGDTPYKYQWKVTRDEFVRLGSMDRDDDPELYDRLNFYNDDVVKAMVEDYRAKIKKYVSKRLRSTNKKATYRYTNVVPYIPKRQQVYDVKYATIPFFTMRNVSDEGQGTDDYRQLRIVSDHNFERRIDRKHISTKSYTYMSISDFNAYIDNWCDYVLNEIAMNYDEPGYHYYGIENAIHLFMFKVPMNVKIAKCPEFINAFRGTGAYYTLENLIKYHNCKLYCYANKDVDDDTLKAYSKSAAIKKLIALRDECAKGQLQYYRLFGVLKATIEGNALEEKIRNCELY